MPAMTMIRRTKWRERERVFFFIINITDGRTICVQYTLTHSSNFTSSSPFFYFFLSFFFCSFLFQNYWFRCVSWCACERFWVTKRWPTITRRRQQSKQPQQQCDRIENYTWSRHGSRQTINTTKWLTVIIISIFFYSFVAVVVVFFLSCRVLSASVSYIYYSYIICVLVFSPT